MSIERRIIRELGYLGTTPDAIGYSLYKQNCKGVRHCGSKCPLAIYLRRQGWGSGLVGGSQVIIRKLPVSLSKCLQVFVSQFDAGKYPELDLEASL